MIELGGAWNNELTEMMELEQHMQHIWFRLVWLTEQHGHANINLEATFGSGLCGPLGHRAPPNPTWVA